MISSQFSLLNPLDHPHWSLFSNHQLTSVSRSQTAPSSMPQLTCGTIFLLLFVFLISSILYHHPALPHLHTLIPDRLLTFHSTFIAYVYICPQLLGYVIHRCRSALTLSPPIPLRLYTLPYWSNPPFLIFDIRALWRSVLSATAPEFKMVG